MLISLSNAPLLIKQVDKDKCGNTKENSKLNKKSYQNLGSLERKNGSEMRIFSQCKQSMTRNLKINKIGVLEHIFL